MRRHDRFGLPVLFLIALLACRSGALQAHEFKLDATINAFVTVERGAAHLVVRTPLYLFKSARFPTRNVEIDVARSDAAIGRALDAIKHDIVLYADGRELDASGATGRLSLPSDRSFDGYEHATAHVAEPTAPDTSIYIDQGYVDAHIVYPLERPDAEIALRSNAAPELGNALKVTVRYQPFHGDGRTLMMTSSSGMVALNPTWWRAATGFVGLGMQHILTGADHVLFLLCLIIPLRGWRQLLAIITTFTVAHSLTLIGSAFHLAPTGAWFPPSVETTIAASIVYMACENIIGIDFARRMLIAGLFGLVHGFGFSYGLAENLQFAGNHLLVSLFAFNVGIEAGQLIVLALMLPALILVRRYVLPGRVGMIILSAFVAQTGWQWMIARGEAMLAAPWPRVTLSGVAIAAFWLAGLVLAAGVLRALAHHLQRSPTHRSMNPLQSSAAD